LGDVGIDEKIILKSLTKYGFRMWSRLVWVKIGSSRRL